MHSARRPPASGFLIDGEAIVCGEDGIADFERLHSRDHEASAFLYAFDLLAVAGMDIRHDRLDDRRAKLRQLPSVPDGIHFSEHYAGDGEVMFRHACKLGLEGIVSKRRDACFPAGARSGSRSIEIPAVAKQAKSFLQYGGSLTIALVSMRLCICARKNFARRPGRASRNARPPVGGEEAASLSYPIPMPVRG